MFIVILLVYSVYLSFLRVTVESRSCHLSLSVEYISLCLHCISILNSRVPFLVLPFIPAKPICSQTPLLGESLLLISQVLSLSRKGGKNQSWTHKTRRRKGGAFVKHSRQRRKERRAVTSTTRTTRLDITSFSRSDINIIPEFREEEEFYKQLPYVTASTLLLP